jgi:hypothetical protein
MKRTPVDPRNSSFGEHKKEKKKKEKERKEKKEKKRMGLRPGDEIRNKRDDVLATEGKLSKDAGGVILELDIDDRAYTYRLDVLSDGGGNNVVYSISSMVGGAWVHLDDILIRLQRLPGDSSDSSDSSSRESSAANSESSDEPHSRMTYGNATESAHEDEVSIGRELAGRGISPYIYLDLRLEYALAGTKVTVFGTAMERFAHSLRDVASCPTLMRWFFVECDGESALVDLYVRAARYVRCIDTKPSNVVVNLPLTGEKRIIALIDTDEEYCGSVDDAKPITGRFRVEDLSRYLEGIKRPVTDKRTRLGENPVLVATVSLMMHVTVSAIHDDKEFGFPYPRITQTLLDNWDIVEALVLLDAADRTTTGKHRMAESARVINNIGHYCKPVDNAPPICEWRGLRGFLEKRTSAFMTRALVACSGNDIARPELYEFVAQMNIEGSKSVTPESLEALVGRMEGHNVRSRCMLDECPYHQDESAVVRYAPQGPRERRSIHVNEIPDPAYGPLLRSVKESDTGSPAALVYHALVEDHGETSAIEVAWLVHSRAHSSKKATKGDKATKENKLAKWLKKNGVMRSLAEIAAKALAPRQMAHFA